MRELERTAGARVQNRVAREQWLIEWRRRWPDTASEDAAALIGIAVVLLFGAAMIESYLWLNT